MNELEEILQALGATHPAWYEMDEDGRRKHMLEWHNLVPRNPSAIPLWGQFHQDSHAPWGIKYMLQEGGKLHEHRAVGDPRSDR